MKSWAEAHRYPGGILKYLYDTVKGLDTGATNNTTNDTALANRVQALEKILSTDISFTVKDDQSTPEAIENATVTINGKTGKTGAAGGCTVKDILYGTYDITVTATGFSDYTGTITVDASHTSFNITLTSTN